MSDAYLKARQRLQFWVQGEHQDSDVAADVRTLLDEGDAHVWRVRAEYAERRLTELNRSLDPLCPCDVNPETTRGPEQECPLHGDGVSFVQQVRYERAELAQRRASVTTGGPPAPFTPGWTSGPCQDVELPLEDETVDGFDRYGDPEARYGL